MNYEAVVTLLNFGLIMFIGLRYLDHYVSLTITVLATQPRKLFILLCQCEYLAFQDCSPTYKRTTRLETYRDM